MTTSAMALPTASSNLLVRKPFTAITACRPRLAVSQRLSRPSQKTQAMFGGGGTRSKDKTGTAYICKDCGYIEADFTSKVAKDDKYRCPVCNAPKRRFSVYKAPVDRNVNSTATRKARKAELQNDSSGHTVDAIPAGTLDKWDNHVAYKNILTTQNTPQKKDNSIDGTVF